MDGRQNCSLACLLIENQDRKIPAISVQLIDAKRVYLVAIREHVDAHAARDMCITDADASAMWLEYYNQMLWGPAIKVVENGHVNEAARQRLQAEIR